VAFQDYLLTVEHPDRCSIDKIIKHCTVFTNVCTTLDTISSKICMKFQEPGDEDYDILQKALQNLDYLWKNAGLSYTPKSHSVLVHEKRASAGIRTGTHTAHASQNSSILVQ
jgi:hypothetical protein